MSANNYLQNQDMNINPGRVTAFFADKNNAYRAMTELKQQGFQSEQIGLAVQQNAGEVDSFDNTAATLRGDEGQVDPDLRSRGMNTEHHHSFWQNVKEFFSGESHDQGTEPYDSDFETSSSNMGWSNERASYYSQGLSAGGAVLTVNGGDSAQAMEIFERCGGDLRDSGFGQKLPSDQHLSSVNDENRSATIRDNLADIGQRRIQLRGELLRVSKERVQRGEVNLRKEVVTENQTIEVPVTREELVIERTQPNNASPTGEIGSDSDIRIPLSEERVTPEKISVVNEEVQIGKRQVTSSERVSSDVRHEELRVEGDEEAEKLRKSDPHRAA